MDSTYSRWLESQNDKIPLEDKVSEEGLNKLSVLIGKDIEEHLSLLNAKVEPEDWDAIVNYRLKVFFNQI